MFHLNPVQTDVALFVFMVVIEEPAVEHDRVVQLRDLVGLRQVCIDVMLAIKLDLRLDSAAERQRCSNGEVEALLIEHR